MEKKRKKLILLEGFSFSPFSFSLFYFSKHSSHPLLIYGQLVIDIFYNKIVINNYAFYNILMITRSWFIVDQNCFHLCYTYPTPIYVVYGCLLKTPKACLAPNLLLTSFGGQRIGGNIKLGWILEECFNISFLLLTVLNSCHISI